MSGWRETSLLCTLQPAGHGWHRKEQNKSKPKTEKNADPKAVMTDKTDDLATLNGPSYTR